MSHLASNLVETSCFNADSRGSFELRPARLNVVLTLLKSSIDLVFSKSRRWEDSTSFIAVFSWNQYNQLTDLKRLFDLLDFMRQTHVAR